MSMHAYHWFWAAAFSALCSGSVFAHGISDTDVPIVDRIGECTVLEDTFDRLLCYGELCTSSVDCAKSLLIAATEAGGPPSGINVLHDLMSVQTTYGILSDGHEYAHIVGRQAAKHFGLVGEVFMQCPRDFFYGCGHGFFEIALALADSQSGAAVGVCGSLPEGQRFVCYHGVGHGLMMSHGNRVHESLAICNQLPKEELGDQGCWQGVFMENVNTYIRREPLQGAFDPKDPLAPCNRMDAKYHRECYLNQAAVLVGHAGNSIAKAARYCLKARSTGTGPCIEGLGQFATNVGWQELVSGKTYSDETFLPRAVELCGTFPSEYISLCETAAAGNLVNYDSSDQALVFCGILSKDHADACYRKIVMEMNRPLIMNKDRAAFCEKLPSEYRSLCIVSSDVASSGMPEVIATPNTSTFASRLWHGIVRIVTAPFRLLVYIASEQEERSTVVDEAGGDDIVSSEDEGSDAVKDQLTVHYDHDKFEPSNIRISVGTTVLWVNDGDGYLWPASDDHPSHAIYPLFDAKRAVTKEKPWSFTFDKVGTWTFHNHLSPYATGTIIVE